MVEVTVVGSRAVVGLAGEFDAANADEIRSVAAELVDEGVVDLIVDLSGVTFIGSAGLRALLLAGELIEAAGGRMTLVGATAWTTRVVALAGLDGVLHLTAAA